MRLYEFISKRVKEAMPQILHKSKIQSKQMNISEFEEEFKKINAEAEEFTSKIKAKNEELEKVNSPEEYAAFMKKWYG